MLLLTWFSFFHIPRSRLAPFNSVVRTELKGASLDWGMWKKENQVNNNTYPLIIKVHLNTSHGSTVRDSNLLYFKYIIYIYNAIYNILHVYNILHIYITYIMVIL